MDIVTVVLAVLLVIATGLAWFFGGEYRRKTGVALDFFEKAQGIVVPWEYRGARSHGIPIGMHNIVLSANRPFHTMIGLKLAIPLLGTGYDPMKCVASRPQGGAHVIVLNTWLANGSVGWRFVVSEPEATYKIELDSPNCGEATVVCPPHWWQRLGFFA